MEVEIKTASEEEHVQFAEDICLLMEQAALQSGDWE